MKPSFSLRAINMNLVEINAGFPANGLGGICRNNIKKPETKAFWAMQDKVDAAAMKGNSSHIKCRFAIFLA